MIVWQIQMAVVFSIAYVSLKSYGEVYLQRRRQLMQALAKLRLAAEYEQYGDKMKLSFIEKFRLRHDGFDVGPEDTHGECLVSFKNAYDEMPQEVKEYIHHLSNRYPEEHIHNHAQEYLVTCKRNRFNNELHYKLP